MKVICKTNPESTAIRTMREVLANDLPLLVGFLDAGVEPDRLEDPDYADYLGDLLVQELGEEVSDAAAVRRVLQEQHRRRRGYRDRFVGQVTDVWERYPLEDLLRLVWRHREEAIQLCFLKGDRPRDEMPEFWHLELRREGARQMLYCHAAFAPDFLRMVLTDTWYATDRAAFEETLRDFLEIENGTVWLSANTTVTMEVEE